MLNKRRAVIEAASAVRFRLQSTRRQLFTVNFNDYVSMGLPQTLQFTSSYNLIRSALLNVQADGRTALYDIITIGLQHLQNGTHPKKALVVSATVE